MDSNSRFALLYILTYRTIIGWFNQKNNRVILILRETCQSLTPQNYWQIISSPDYVLGQPVNDISII